MQRSHWFKTTAAVLVTGVLGLTTAGRVLADVLPGEVITKDTMAKAESLLTPTARWMLQQGMKMPIIPYRKVELPKLYKEASEKYSGQVKLSADGKDLFNYVAGLPFLTIDPNDPLAGYRIMWNQEQKPAYIDNYTNEGEFQLINAKGESERFYGLNNAGRMMWTGRLYYEPKPVIPHNPPLRYTEQFGPLYAPNDLKGTSALTFRYLAPNLPDDSYFYSPELRRVRRVGIANRSDAFWGTDMDLDSFWGFAAKVSFWTFRLLAEKEILGVVHAGKYGQRDAWCAQPDGQSGTLAMLPCTLNWEKRPVYVVEGLPTGYSQYAFSKRILYVDKDFWNMNFSEMYDQGGELWRGWVNCFHYSKKPYEGYPTVPRLEAKYNYEDEWPFTPYIVMLDMQVVHATTVDAPSGYKKPTEWTNEWSFNEPGLYNTPRPYSISHLIESGRN